MRGAMLAGLAVLSLAACAGERRLHNLDAGLTGPDEFSVLPVLPLDIPATLDLPPPNPGGVNRADRNPLGDGLAALGGTAGAGVAGDPALLAAIGGAPADIRATVATEDAAFRRSAGALSGPNLFGRDRYFPAYARQALDAWAELLRFRNLGVQVPSAPPGQ